MNVMSYISSRPVNRMVRSKEVVSLTGLSKTTLWRLEKEGMFPSRRQLSPGSVGWSLDEIEEWIKERKVVK